MKIITLRNLFALVFLGNVLVSQAGPIAWTLENVLYEINPQSPVIYEYATGGFTYDADTGLYSDVQINFASQHFTQIGPLPSDSTQLFTTGTPHGWGMFLLFDQPLTNYGGTIAAQTEVWSEFGIDPDEGGGRVVADAQIPVPPTLLLLMLGFGSLAFSRRNTGA